MRTYIQILDDRAHWKFTAITPPTFAPNITLVDVTDLFPQPDEGWRYEEGSFFPPEKSEQETWRAT